MSGAVRYVSTRQAGPVAALGFEDILLAGLAPDGGLYVPETVPVLGAEASRALATEPYHRVAAAVLRLFAPGFLDDEGFETLAAETYRGFGHAAVAPLKQLGHDQWLMELFHGPTLAFKDYALQLVGRLFEAALARRGERITIVGATSGDTGSAAIEACRDRSTIDIVILYPHGRTSEVQRRQMTTVMAPNVHAIAVEGSFDDCQDLVKALFADERFRARHRLSAVNSINWARIAAQIAYYVAAAAALGAPDRPVRFAVPTGNFGNVYAGHVARAIGVGIETLVIGTNRNDILWRFIETGEMRIGAVEPSLSPSMDIQVSSNFERLYFDLVGRDGARVADAMARFRATGLLPATTAQWQAARGGFVAHRLDDPGIEATIGSVWRATGELLDPHSAVAVSAMRAQPAPPGIPTVALACAHPAKFPDVVERATGRRPALPPHLADLMDRPERTTVLPADLDRIRAFIDDRAPLGKAA